MTHARCCTECGKGDCCEFAGASWANRYCIEVSGEYLSEDCDCSACETLGLNCDECNDEGKYCCREYELRWCVAGPIFRFPPGGISVPGGICNSEEGCPDEGTNLDYTTCPDPWVAPDWGIAERGCSSTYLSAVETFTTCGLCTTASANDRVRYQVYHRAETMAGDQCFVVVDGNPVPFADIDDYYEVEGVARIECIGSASDGGCDENITYTHRLVIEPCEDPSPLPKPPKLVYIANLTKNTPPHAANVWTLQRTEFVITLNGTGDVACDTVPPSCEGYSAPCSEITGGAGCDGCKGETFSISNLSVLNAYPCTDPCGQFE